MKILITGSDGQLGRAIQEQLRASGLEIDVIKTSHNTLDITDLGKVREVLLKVRPEVVINCAAYTAVDLCETEVELAYKVNALGPKHLAMIANEIEAKLVHISTDYVFNGNISEPRREDSGVEPQCVYGKSKLLGEEYVKAFCKRYFIIRTAWLYGEGDNFVGKMLRLAKTKKEINIVGDQYGSPTSTKDLAKVIIELMQTDYYGVFHGSCEGECSWYEFACKIFDITHINIRVNKISSAEFRTLAKRPKYSVLDNFMLKLYGMNSFRHWEEALIEYLETINKS